MMCGFAGIAWPSHLPILLAIGLAVVFGTIGAKLFQRLRIPQVVGYIAIGFVAGRSVLDILDEQTVQDLQPFTFFALGVIGFMVGGELRLESFRRYGRSFLTILLSEGLMAFVFVGIVTSLGAWALTGNPRMSVALGIVLGAISSATAPAATVDVLWEYKTRGRLTTTVLAIVALDDGLSLLLYALAASLAGVLLGSAHGGALTLMGGVAYELSGAALLGVGAAVLLNFILRHVEDPDKTLPFTIGSLALVIGLARALRVDLILSTMSLGAFLVNLAPRRSRRAFDTIQAVVSPIYVLFFVIVGARLYIARMPAWLWMIAGLYVLGRTGGKMLGAYLGAVWSRAPAKIRKYLGLCLFSQAGVAIGLAVLAGDSFPAEMGEVIVAVVTATTFLVQIIGPPCVKLAAARAGEGGLNVTEEDLLRSYKVSDMVDPSVPTLRTTTPLEEIVRIVGATDATSYPVVDAEGRLLGVVTMNQLRRTFLEGELSKLLVAYDLMEPPPEPITADLSLSEGLARMRQLDLDYLPVVAEGTGRDGGGKLLGVLDQATVRHRLSQEVIRRAQLAEEEAAAGDAIADSAGKH